MQKEREREVNRLSRATGLRETVYSVPADDRYRQVKLEAVFYPTARWFAIDLDEKFQPINSTRRELTDDLKSLLRPVIPQPTE